MSLFLLKKKNEIKGYIHTNKPVDVRNSPSIGGSVIGKISGRFPYYTTADNGGRTFYTVGEGQWVVNYPTGVLSIFKKTP